MRKVQRAFRIDNGLRGPAAGRAQQEARAAAAAAAAQQQLRSEADVRALMEVSMHACDPFSWKLLFNLLAGECWRGVCPASRLEAGQQAEGMRANPSPQFSKTREKFSYWLARRCQRCWTGRRRC